ncbi:MAG: cadherin-like domain-containing protein, partial [Crocosphaera sp.]
DSAGDDTLVIENIDLSLELPSPGIAGIQRDNYNLIIDLNADGVIAPEDDLTIVNFFAETSGTEPGTGFIETVDNLTGNQIINFLNPHANQEPILNINNSLILDQGATAIIDNSFLQVTDSNNSVEEITYTLTYLPNNGILKLDGITLILNSTFTQADIDNNLLTYEHNDSETRSDSFKFSVSDSFDGTISEKTFNVNVNDVVEIPDQAPEQLQFNVSVDNDTVTLTNARIYDADGYDNLQRVDLWVKRDGDVWQDIADITNFNPSEDNTDWAIINHQIDFSNYESGSYKIWAKAYDNQGLGSNEILLTFEFERANIAPEQLQFKIDKQNYAPTETLILEDALIYDENGSSDIVLVDFWVKSPDGDWINVPDVDSFTPLQTNNNWGMFTYTLDLEQFIDKGAGTYTIWGQGEDNGGAKSNIIEKTFEITDNTETIVQSNAEDNIAPSPTGLDGYFDIDKQVYTSNDTLQINNGWVRDLNGVSDIQRIDFWLIKEGETWQDIEDISRDEITPWDQDSTWGSFDYSLGLTGLTPGSYTLWSGVQDQELADNGTWANIVENHFEILP